MSQRKPPPAFGRVANLPPGGAPARLEGRFYASADPTPRPVITGRALLLVVLMFLPWPLGCAEPQVQVVLYPLAGIALVCWLMSIRRESTTDGIMPTSMLPFLAAILLAVLQLAPLGSWGTRLSPQATSIRATFDEPVVPLAGNVLDNVPVPAERRDSPISIYPAGTRQALAALVLAVAMFLLGARLFREERGQMSLLAALALSGALVGLFGMVQMLTWNGRIFWTFPLALGGQPFGPFVNRNHAGAYLNLCLAAAIALALWMRQRARTSEPDDARKYRLARQEMEALDGSQHTAARLRRKVLALLAELDGLTVASIGCAAVIVTCVLCSLSRSAILSMVGGGVVTLAAALVVGYRLRWWLAAVAVAAALLVIGWLGMSVAIEQRLATLTQSETLAAEPRLSAWKPAVRAAGDYLVAGSGLGTYGFTYRMYETTPQGTWARHAENQYIEALLEGGLPGLLLLLASIALLGCAAVQILRYASLHGGAPLAIAGVFALTTLVIHSCFDYALYTPAVGLTAALLMGATTGRAIVIAQSPGFRAARLLALPRIAGLPSLAAALLLLAMIFGFQEVRGLAAVQSASEKTGWPYRELTRDAVTLQQQLSALDAAVRNRWDDAEGQLALASLWMQRYRLAAFEQLSSQLEPLPEKDELWRLSSPDTLHLRASQAEATGNLPRLQRLKRDPIVLANLGPAWQHLLAARRACPTYAQVHLELARICFITQKPSTDAVHLARCDALGSWQAGLMYQAGLAHLRAGRNDRAWYCLRQAWLCNPGRYGGPVFELASRRLGIDGLIERVIPPWPDVLVGLARDRFASPDQKIEREALLLQALTLLDTQELPEDHRAYLLGTAARLREQNASAISYLTKAVELRPQEVRWRYELALVLLEAGRFDAAREHASRCMRIDPQHRGQYESLLKQILQAQASAGPAERRTTEGMPVVADV